MSCIFFLSIYVLLNYWFLFCFPRCSKLSQRIRKTEVKLKILSGIHQAHVLVWEDAHWVKPVPGDGYKPAVMLWVKSYSTHLSRFVLCSLHVLFWKLNSGLCSGSGYPMVMHTIWITYLGFAAVLIVIHHFDSVVGNPAVDDCSQIYIFFDSKIWLMFFIFFSDFGFLWQVPGSSLLWITGYGLSILFGLSSFFDPCSIGMFLWSAAVCSFCYCFLIHFCSVFASSF